MVDITLRVKSDPVPVPMPTPVGLLWYRIYLTS
jgi:hypothetical protein